MPEPFSRGLPDSFEVQKGTGDAVAVIPTAVNRVKEDKTTLIKQKTQDEIAEGSTRRNALLNKVLKAAADDVVAAMNKKAADEALPSNDLSFLTVILPEYVSGWQIAYDMIPSWQTVAIAGAAVAVTILVPGAGVVLVPVGLGLLTAGASRSADSRFEQGQSYGESIIGGLLDAGGVIGLYSDITNQGLTTGAHLALTPQQQREQTVEGIFQFGLIAFGSAAKVVKSFTKGKPPAATPGKVTPPGKPTKGSDAGNKGAAQGESLSTCFAAGTKIR